MIPGMPIPTWVWYLLVGIASGAIALYMWPKFTRQTHIQEHKPEPRDRFERIRLAMPGLIGEMARDVMENPTVRWCVPLDSKSMASHVSREHFSYYASDHPSLFAKFEILQMNGYLKEVTPGNRWEPANHRIYAMTEEFVQRLRRAT
jgi:hypothetical protein